MKLLHYVKDDNIRAGIVQDNLVYDLQELAALAGISELKDSKTIDEILWKNQLNLVRESTTTVKKADSFPVSSAKLKSPILRPQKIFLAAVNYISHGKEQGISPPFEPYFFTKFRNTVIGPKDPIVIPRVSRKVDWEAELGVIIGKRGKYISKREAMDYVAGYTVCNDISFRDLQLPEGWPAKSNPLGHNWVKGKGLDSSFPSGPWMVTSEEMQDPYSSEILLRINGIERQRSLAREMVFKIDYLIEYLSAGITLEPGDIISTGTPLGVAAFTGAPYLKSGDVVETSISTIGELRNPVTAEG